LWNCPDDRLAPSWPWSRDPALHDMLPTRQPGRADLAGPRRSRPEAGPVAFGRRSGSSRGMPQGTVATRVHSATIPPRGTRNDLLPPRASSGVSLVLGPDARRKVSEMFVRVGLMWVGVAGGGPLPIRAPVLWRAGRRR
jgi:hypothetical protein